MYIYIYFFLCGFSLTNIHDSQKSRGRGRLYIENKRSCVGKDYIERRKLILKIKNYMYKTLY